jgi:hypothetical protein
MDQMSRSSDSDFTGLDRRGTPHGPFQQEAQARFLELLEKHRLIGERLLAVARAWGATPGNA